MTDLPKHVDKRVRQALAHLDQPWTLIKKRDHYFVRVGNRPMMCIGNNSSRQNDFLVQRTLGSLRTIAEK